MKRRTFAAVCAATLLAASTAWAQGVVTIYSADGLHDGSPNWFQTQFDAFTKATGIKVQYVEGGSAGVMDRVAKEKSNPQADVLVTLPPFMQKAAADGLLQPYTPADADEIAARDKDPQGRYYALVNDYPNFIYDASVLQGSAEDLRRPARSQIQEQAAILHARPGGRRHRRHAAGVPRLRQQGRRLRLSEEIAGQQPRPIRLHRQADPAGQQG